jgi:hypothetical protein
MYKLSVELELEPAIEYEISLLPPYTYSQMMKEISEIESNTFVDIQILTYSLMGLAIPIITFTNKA